MNSNDWITVCYCNYNSNSHFWYMYCFYIYISPTNPLYIYIITTVLSIYYTYIWSFPKMGLPPVIIHFSMDFPWNRPAAVTWPQRGGAVLGLPRPGGAWKSRNTLRQRPMKNGAFYRDCREYRGFIGDKYIYVHIYIYMYIERKLSTTRVFGWDNHLQLGFSDGNIIYN